MRIGISTLLAIWLVLLVRAGGAVAQPAAANAPTLTTYRGSVLYIETWLQNEDGTNRRVIPGTGFILSPSGYVLTAAHVAPEAKPNEQVKYWAKIRTKSDRASWQLQLIRSDPKSDASILQFADSGLTLQPVRIASPNPTVPLDSRLYALGFPNNSDQASMEGMLSALAPDRGWWQTTLPLNHGNSGGPVFNTDLKVVGMAAAGMEEAQQITYVVPINLLYPVIMIVPGLASGIGFPEMPEARNSPRPTHAPHTVRSYWTHNGSLMYLVAQGAGRSFYYQKPRDSLVPVGVNPNTLLFRGRKVESRYEGTAFFFSKRCGAVAYDVSGPIENDGTRVVLFGRKPLLNSSCNRYDYKENDKLVFEFEARG